LGSCPAHFKPIRNFRRRSIVEIFAQRRSPVFLLAQATPLKLWNDQIDKFRGYCPSSEIRAQNEAAVGAGLQLLER
jgi:hypothetical protein